MVIAFFGPKRSGKDTIANLTAQRLPGTKFWLSFSGPIKTLVRDLLGLGSRLTDTELKESQEIYPGLSPERLRVLEDFLEQYRLQPLTSSERFLVQDVARERPLGEVYRRLLQLISTDVVRARDPYFWIRLFRRRLRMVVGSYRYVFVTDGRLWTEFEALRGSALTVGVLRLATKNNEDPHVTEREARQIVHQCDLKYSLPEGEEHLHRTAQDLAFRVRNGHEVR